MNSFTYHVSEGKNWYKKKIIIIIRLKFANFHILERGKSIISNGKELIEICIAWYSWDRFTSHLNEHQYCNQSGVKSKLEWWSFIKQIILFILFQNKKLIKWYISLVLLIDLKITFVNKKKKRSKWYNINYMKMGNDDSDVLIP